MEQTLETAVQALKERFGIEHHEYAGEVNLIVPPGLNVEVARALRDEFGFDMLVAETAVDYWPEETPRFHVIYQIYSMRDNRLIRMRVPLEGNAPRLRTVEGVWPNANWYEREVYDMFGVTYEGHSDLRRILMPHDWVGHPLRKDYPLGYEEVRFTFNYQDVDRRKPIAKE
jgi:NADH-quinone oxidoreductase subunit C